VVALLAWLINTRSTLTENNRAIFHLVLGLIVVGIFLWLINTYVPMAGSIKAILNIVVVVAVCIRVLQVFGLWDPTVRLWNNLTHRTSH
jgi:predicted membrane protein